MRRRALLATLSGALYALAQPPFGFTWLACVALVPLLVACERAPIVQRGIVGWMGGTAAGLFCVGPSVYEAARLYFELPVLASALVALLVPFVYGAPFFALFALAAGPALDDDRGVLRPLVVVPAAWAVSELARSNIGHGTPWCLLAHSQVGVPELLQTASFGGAFAVSFLMAQANVGALSLARLATGVLPRRTALLRSLTASGVLLAAFAYGAREVDRWERPLGEPMQVAIVQGNIPSEWRGKAVYVPAILERHLSLSRSAAESTPALVVWPENAVGFVADANSLPLERAAAVLDHRASLILGAPRSVVDQEGHATFRNTAFLVSEQGEILRWQDKRRLTPFAEYWPAWIPRPAGRDDRYGPGEGVALLEVGALRVGVLICYEAIYPDLARDLVDEGAEILVNISNDAWFGASAALQQHLGAARLRAVELRRYLVRATNTGLSAVVAPTGKIVAAIAPGEPGVAGAEVEGSSWRTPYARFGDAFTWLCALVVAIDLLRGKR